MVGLGISLRVRHLGTPSLWWDEMVHLRTAGAASLTETFSLARDGVMPYVGNAGAMPLDYLLLHLYLAVVPQPAPEGLEVYYRTPSCFWSCLTLVVLYAYARRFFGRFVAIVSTLALAVSVPHILYAVEVRFYSLLVLLTVVNLWAFSWLVADPGARRRWIGFTLVNVLYLLSGLFAVFVMASEFAVLLLSPRGADRPKRLHPALLWSGGALAAAVVVYFLGRPVAYKYGRSGFSALSPWGSSLHALDFFALFDTPLYWMGLASLPAALWWAWRRWRARLPIVAMMAASFLAIPLAVLLVRWKQYYFHPRHVLFLLPFWALLIGLGWRWVAGLVPSRWFARATLVAAAGLLLMGQSEVLRIYKERPLYLFARTKKVWDFKALVRDLRTRVDALEPDKHYLVIGEGAYPGYQANPCLSVYLRWYHLDDRIVLRSTANARHTLDEILQRGIGVCRGVKDSWLELHLGMLGVGRSGLIGLLLGLDRPIGEWPLDVRACGVLVYSDDSRKTLGEGFDSTPYEGFVLLEPPWNR